MSKVIIVGSGIIGASIAYELSTIARLSITLIDEKTPASGSTGAALGVLMGAISHKTQGKAWKMRSDSLERYETLIPELESLTGITIPFNRQGIVRLHFVDEAKEHWEKLVKIRHSQGWDLEIWNPSQLEKYCPQIQNKRVVGAIYSSNDRQVHPTILTQALVTAASINGVNCKFDIKVQDFRKNSSDLFQITTTKGILSADWLVICAGVGSRYLTDIDIRPVLGQALKLKLEQPLGYANFQPVITGEDVHIVPLGNDEYWIGATVEFPSEQGELLAKAELLEQMRQTAIAFCPELAPGRITQTWFGKRPRPEGKAAPVIERHPDYDHVLLATGHYRNGILLAPATAKIIREWITLFD